MKHLRQIISVFTALVLWTGAFLLLPAFTARVPRGVTVNGTAVGGLKYAVAYSRLLTQAEEGLRGKRLDICADEHVYEFIFPEIEIVQDFRSALRAAKKGESIISPVSYRLADEEGVIRRIAAAENRQAEENSVKFNPSGSPFTIVRGRAGRVLDEGKLRADIEEALGGRFGRVYASFNYVQPVPTEEEIARDTAELCRFSTAFDDGAKERAHNISLAASKLSGVSIAAGGVLSFNATVGARTAANGFRIAKIIEGGRFVPGYGGGVCQVSTTLYNAALLAGLEVVEYHPHSLLVSYVPPSRDAMVSGDYFDLKIRNTRPSPVYIRAEVSGGVLTFTLYGREDGFDYSFETQLGEPLPCPQPVVVEGDEDKIISPAREGTVSCCYLIKKKGGSEERMLLREDKYLPVAEVRQVRRKALSQSAA